MRAKYRLCFTSGKLLHKKYALQARPEGLAAEEPHAHLRLTLPPSDTAVFCRERLKLTRPVKNSSMHKLLCFEASSVRKSKS